MDKLESMATLIAAVEAGSLSSASRRLRVPLATVSRKVSELEAHLGTKLLTRTSRRLVLTDSGRSYVEACKSILENIEEAERTANGEYTAPKGALTITAPIVFGRLHVLPVVIEFLKAYPDINIRMGLSDRMVNLVEEHIDLAVRIGELPDSTLIALRTGTTRRSVCGSPAYFAERGTPETPSELEGHDCIAFEGFASGQSWTFLCDGEGLEAAVRPRLSVNTAEAAIEAAVAGLGVTRVLSYQIVDAIRAGKLIPVLESFEPPALPVSFVYGSRGLMPLKLRAFLDFAAPRLKARLAASQPMRGSSLHDWPRQ